MAPYEVKEDPLRTWGVRAGFVVSLLARIKSGTIFAVQPGSGAAKAGLHPGDRIISFDGKPVEKMSIFSLISKAKAALADGALVELGVCAPGSSEVRIAHFKFMPEGPRLWPPVDFGRTGRALPGPPPANRTAEIWPAASGSRAGSATPRAALESAFCDRAHGDIDGLTGLLAFDPAAKRRLDAIFRGLPDAGKAYYGTAERLMAALIDTENLPAAVRILKETSDHPDAALLRVKLRFFDDFYHQSYDENFHLILSSGRWRWSVSARAVQAYADYYARVPFAVAPDGSSAGLPWLYLSF